MANADDTPRTPPPSEAPPPETPAGGPPPKKGMSTGAKVAIGCGGLVVVVLVVLVVAAVAGGLFFKNKAEEFAGGVEAQAEATETIQRLERERPFQPPADGVVGEDRAERFFAVTDDAWERMRDRVEDLADRAERIDERGGEAGFGDVMAGMRGLGGGRVALAESLEEYEMPVSEYLWTGLTLLRAYEFLEVPAGGEGVPAQNIALANRYRDELAEIAESDEDGRPDRSFVLGMAWTLGASEGAVRSGLGLDTLGAYAP